eukprot:509041_1
MLELNKYDTTNHTIKNIGKMVIITTFISAFILGYCVFAGNMRQMPPNRELLSLLSGIKSTFGIKSQPQNVELICCEFIKELITTDREEEGGIKSEKVTGYYAWVEQKLCTRPSTLSQNWGESGGLTFQGITRWYSIVRSDDACPTRRRNNYISDTNDPFIHFRNSSRIEETTSD